jgi:predicted nucleic acid-binding protein
MKKVFLDTNVVLDYYLDREGFSDDAEAILAYGYNQGCSLYVSSLTCANMAYIGRKKFPGEAIYAVLASLFEFAEIASVDSNAVKSAVTLQAKDFEDALQYFSAKAIGVDCIVTRNVKDFPFSELQVLTPKDFFHSRLLFILLHHEGKYLRKNRIRYIRKHLYKLLILQKFQCRSLDCSKPKALHPKWISIWKIDR